MKRLTFLIMIATEFFFALVWTGRAGFPGGDDRSWAWNQAPQRFPSRPGGVFARPDHSQRPAPYGFFFHGHRPPAHMHQPFPCPARPGRPPGSHHQYPVHPFFFPLLPYPLFLPHYEPDSLLPWIDERTLFPAGRLLLLADPVHAQAFVDGYPLERNSDLSYEVGLLEGEHQVEVTAEGYSPFRDTVLIPSGRVLRLNIRLVRAWEP